MVIYISRLPRQKSWTLSGGILSHTEDLYIHTVNYFHVPLYIKFVAKFDKFNSNEVNTFKLF